MTAFPGCRIVVGEAADLTLALKLHRFRKPITQIPPTINHYVFHTSFHSQFFSHPVFFVFLRVLCGFIYLSPFPRVSVSPFPWFPVSVFFDYHFGWLQDLPELVDVGEGPLPFRPDLFHNPDKFTRPCSFPAINANDIAVQGNPPIFL
jgi:hypothetical protein